MKFRFKILIRIRSFGSASFTQIVHQNFYFIIFSDGTLARPIDAMVAGQDEQLSWKNIEKTMKMFFY